jgi:hypothetical protein
MVYDIKHDDRRNSSVVHTSNIHIWKPQLKKRFTSLVVLSLVHWNGIV